MTKYFNKFIFFVVLIQAMNSNAMFNQQKAQLMQRYNQLRSNYAYWMQRLQSGQLSDQEKQDISFNIYYARNIELPALRGLWAEQAAREMQQMQITVNADTELNTLLAQEQQKEKQLLQEISELEAQEKKEQNKTSSSSSQSSQSLQSSSSQPSTTVQAQTSTGTFVVPMPKSPSYMRRRRLMNPSLSQSQSSQSSQSTQSLSSSSCQPSTTVQVQTSKDTFQVPKPIPPSSAVRTTPIRPDLSQSQSSQSSQSSPQTSQSSLVPSSSSAFSKVQTQSKNKDLK